jgi:hypothetical protein
MNGGFESDFSKMEKIMRDYIEKGGVIGPQKLKVEPITNNLHYTINIKFYFVEDGKETRPSLLRS